MTDRSDDVLDPFEAVLRRRVLAFSDDAVVPFDATAVARAAMAARRPIWTGRGGAIGGSSRRLG